MNAFLTVCGGVAALAATILGILFLMANTKSDGKSVSHGAHWVTKGGGHVRYATEREMWQHNNPGKNWDDYQNKQRKGCFFALIPVFLILPILLLSLLCTAVWAREAFRSTSLVITFAVMYAVVLAEAALITVISFSAKASLRTVGLSNLDILCLVNILIGILGLIYILVFAFVCGFRGRNNVIPDSGFFNFFAHSFLWVSGGALALLLIDFLVQRIHHANEAGKKKAAAKQQQQAEEEAQQGAKNFIIALAKDKYLACPLCKRSLRSQGTAVGILGSNGFICEKCTAQYKNMVTATIDFQKAEALAQDIRSKLKL